MTARQVVAVLLVAILWGVFIFVAEVPLTVAVIWGLFVGLSTGYLAGKYL